MRTDRRPAGATDQGGADRVPSRAGLDPDGVVGPRTRRALGRHGKHPLGSRRLTDGAVGWDVAELQFLLAWHGFPSGPFDGAFGSRLAAAVTRFQRFHGLPPIGEAGPLTIAAARESPIPTSPIRLRAPVDAPVGDGFGPRGDAFHAGLDFVVGAGAAVAAAGSGEVTWAGPRGTFGNAVVIAHGDGVRTLYAHLSRIDVASVSALSPAPRSASSARRAALPARTSISRFASAPRASTRARRSTSVRLRRELREPLVKAVDEVGHRFEPLGDHADAVLEEVLGLDVERLCQPFDDVVRRHRPVPVHDVVQVAGREPRSSPRGRGT